MRSHGDVQYFVGHLPLPKRRYELCIVDLLKRGYTVLCWIPSSSKRQVWILWFQAPLPKEELPSPLPHTIQGHRQWIPSIGPETEDTDPPTSENMHTCIESKDFCEVDGDRVCAPVHSLFLSSSTIVADEAFIGFDSSSCFRNSRTPMPLPIKGNIRTLC